MSEAFRVASHLLPQHPHWPKYDFSHVAELEWTHCTTYLQHDTEESRVIIGSACINAEGRTNLMGFVGGHPRGSGSALSSGGEWATGMPSVLKSSHSECPRRDCGGGCKQLSASVAFIPRRAELARSVARLLHGQARRDVDEPNKSERGASAAGIVAGQWRTKPKPTKPMRYVEAGGDKPLTAEVGANRPRSPC